MNRSGGPEREKKIIKRMKLLRFRRGCLVIMTVTLARRTSAQVVRAYNKQQRQTRCGAGRRLVQHMSAQQVYNVHYR